MRAPGGYATWTDPAAARPVERDTFTCAHCSRIVVVEPICDPSAAGGFCRQCMAHLCTRCANRGVCDPFMRKLERAEARDRLLRSIDGV